MNTRTPIHVVLVAAASLLLALALAACGPAPPVRPVPYSALRSRL